MDLASDRAAGIHTLPMLFGEKTSVKIFIAYMIIPFVAVIVCGDSLETVKQQAESARSVPKF